VLAAGFARVTLCPCHALPDFVRQDRTVRLLPEIHKEVRVKGQTALIGVHIQQQQESALAETETGSINLSKPSGNFTYRQV
jgi:hypothetical protein